MTFTTNEIKFKKIKQGEADFLMTDGIKLVPRATIEISQRCPSNYASLIQECIGHGWLKPVAYTKESEYVWEKIQE